MPLLRAHPAVKQLDVFLPPGLAAHDSLSWPRGDALRGYRQLRRHIARFLPDVVFIPTARWFDSGGIPTVVMVRNMEPLEVPFGGNTWREGAKNLVRSRTARRACLRADRVLAVSQHVRDFIHSRWHLDPARIGVVPHGIDPPTETGATRPHSLGEMGGDAFVFTAGSVRPARGLEDVIEAMALDAGSSWKLVVGGGVDRGSEHYARRLRDLATKSRVTDRILWAGQLNASEMAWCFRNAELFVMTSRAEACPNIALEAMSHGALTVSGDNAPMPEFFQQSARYYRSGDASSLAHAIRELRTLGPAEKEALRVRARQRSLDFDWNITAQRTIEELQKAMA